MKSTTQRAMAQQATHALITIQGGMRFCASCRTLQPAGTFVTLRLRRSAIMRCAVCASKRKAGAQ